MKQSGIMSKIKKLFALSKENESKAEGEAALQKALQLMAQYNLTRSDIELSEVIKVEGKKRKVKLADIPEYITALYYTIATYFACHVVYMETVTIEGDKKKYSTIPQFIGLGANPEIAEYVYTYLSRILQKDLRNFKSRKRLRKTIEKDKRDYAMGWVCGVHEKYANLRPERPAAVDTYLQQQHIRQVSSKELKNGKGKASNAKINPSFFKGLKDGEKQNINKPIGNTNTPQKEKALPSGKSPQLSLFN